MAAGDRKNADVALLATLAGGATHQEAAQQAGVSERTVYRRLADDTFRRQLSEARSELIKRAVGKLDGAASTAASALTLLLKADSESVRLGAARSILELAVKLRESEELEARIAALEERQAAEAPPARPGRRRASSTATQRWRRSRPGGMRTSGSGRAGRSRSDAPGAAGSRSRS